MHVLCLGLMLTERDCHRLSHLRKKMMMMITV